VLQLVAVAVAAIALVGTLFFGWEFGDGGTTSTLLGVAVAVIAVGATLYKQFVE
jgi:hypothetical protein